MATFLTYREQEREVCTQYSTVLYTILIGITEELFRMRYKFIEIREKFIGGVKREKMCSFWINVFWEDKIPFGIEIVEE